MMLNLSLIEPESKRRKVDSEINPSSTNCRHSFVCNCRSAMERQERALNDESATITKQLTIKTTCIIDKKLHLVLDLDYTLLHTVMVSKLTEDEKYLLEEEDSRKDLLRFTGTLSIEFLTKLRPFVHEFLKEANKMFSMSVYTMGSRSYANIVLKMIDPEKVYFKDRVITKEDSPDKKTLDLVLVDESRVVIVDDTSSVWPDHQKNLLEISKYSYFRSKTRRKVKHPKSYAEEKKDESRENGSLANVLTILKEVHEGFFGGNVEKESDIGSKDVRMLLDDQCRPKVSC